MRHMLAGENVALTIGRAGHVTGCPQWNLCFCSQFPTDFNLFYRGGNLVFPLYIYDENKSDASPGGLFTAEQLRPYLVSEDQLEGRHANIETTIYSALMAAYGDAASPENIFAYVYAVLHTPTYREAYAEFLRTDFPRIPFAQNAEAFETLAGLGNRLIDLHRLRSSELAPPFCRFNGAADNRVSPNKAKGFRYESDAERVYINPQQYFGPVPNEVWEYRIGGYQVCEKWLKDRRRRCLSLDEVRTYCRLVTALQRTLDLQGEIGPVYRQAEKKLLQLKF